MEQGLWGTSRSSAIWETSCVCGTWRFLAMFTALPTCSFREPYGGRILMNICNSFAHPLYKNNPTSSFFVLLLFDLPVWHLFWSTNFNFKIIEFFHVLYLIPLGHRYAYTWQEWKFCIYSQSNPQEILSNPSAYCCRKFMIIVVVW